MKNDPKIVKLVFPVGKIEIHFADGRILFIPIQYFPSLQKLSPQKRNEYVIGDGEDGQIVVFKYCDDTFTPRDFLAYEMRKAS